MDLILQPLHSKAVSLQSLEGCMCKVCRARAKKTKCDCFSPHLYVMKLERPTKRIHFPLHWAIHCLIHWSPWKNCKVYNKKITIMRFMYSDMVTWTSSYLVWHAVLIIACTNQCSSVHRGTHCCAFLSRGTNKEKMEPYFIPPCTGQQNWVVHRRIWLLKDCDLDTLQPYDRQLQRALCLAKSKCLLVVPLRKGIWISHCGAVARIQEEA